MTDDVIPIDVQQFISTTIDSIAQLEALLLLYANRDAEWSAEAVSKRLYVTERETAGLLRNLHARGFLSHGNHSPGAYQYRPESPELAQMVERLAEVYRQYLVPVTQLIHSKSKSRIQEFADAFRLRKDE